MIDFSKIIKSVAVGLLGDVVALTAMIVIFLVFLGRSSGMLAIGPKPILLILLSISLIVAFTIGFYWEFRRLS